MKNRLIIGTRGSALALWQTNWVSDLLRRAHPGLTIDVRTMTTRGDATQASNVPLSSFGEKGIFAKELEEALLAGQIDLAVHSMKDLAHTLPAGLIIGAVPPRENPADALVVSSPLAGGLDSLPQGARVGTGSVRRRALLAERRPDLQLLEIRGNIDTRLRKLDSGEYDAIILACAGLNRLGFEGRITEELDPAWFIPDPGQGALAVEVREDDDRVREIVAAIDDASASITTRAERAFLQEIGGSCQTPIGAWASIERGADREVLSMRVMLAEDGAVRRTYAAGDWETPEELGRKAARELHQHGAHT